MDRKCKTLIILIPGFPAHEGDSTCLPFPQSFVRNLKRLHPGLNIQVMAFQYPFSKLPYHWQGVNVYPFDGRNKGGLRRILLWRKIWIALKKVFRKNEVVGILNFWMGETALLAQRAAKKYNIKSYAWLMGQDARENNRYVSLASPKPESLIALSDFLSDEFYKNYKIKPGHTIPPGIDERSFPAVKYARTIDILGVGSLIGLKQYDHFIKLISELVSVHPGIRAVICGDGPERKRLQQLILDYNLTGHVELKGEIKHAHILDLMQESKILLHPSSYEGFSTVCAEALYAGAQVVSYCKPMYRSFEHHHIVQTQQEMKNKVIEILDNERMIQSSVLTYPIEETCQKIWALYN